MFNVVILTKITAFQWRSFAKNRFTLATIYRLRTDSNKIPLYILYSTFPTSRPVSFFFIILYRRFFFIPCVFATCNILAKPVRILCWLQWKVYTGIISRAEVLMQEEPSASRTCKKNRHGHKTRILYRVKNV